MKLGWRRNYIRYKEFFLNTYANYKKRQDLKMFLEIILSLVAVILFALFALRPTILTITELLRVIEVKQQLVVKMDQKIQSLNDAQKLYVQEAAHISLLSTAIPDEAAPDAFVKQIEGVAARNSLSLQAVSVGEVVLRGEETAAKSAETTLAQGAKSISFSVSGANSFVPLIQFLKDLESMRRPTRIDGLSLTGPSLDNQDVAPLILLTGQAPFVQN